VGTSDEPSLSPCCRAVGCVGEADKAGSDHQAQRRERNEPVSNLVQQLEAQGHGTDEDRDGRVDDKVLRAVGQDDEGSKEGEGYEEQAAVRHLLTAQELHLVPAVSNTGPRLTVAAVVPGT
jgi:hypothetical protein